MLLTMIRSPMKTITTTRTGLSSTGRTTIRSISTPSTNETISVTTKASQYGKPA
jgi:hypothetical protein